MKIIVATAAATLAALAIAAPASAKPGDGPSVEIRDAVARVVVIVEDRADVAVEIEQGSTDLPRVQVRRREDGDVLIDGGLGGNRIAGIRVGGDGVRNCQSGPEAARQPGEGASVEVRRLGRIEVSTAPLIVVRTPRQVEVDVHSGAIYGTVGRGATSVEVGNGGCGDWTVANVDGPLSLNLAGSGDYRAGSSARLEVNILGSGNVVAGATGGLESNIMGSGNIDVARVDGAAEANIMGSGDILVRGGAASRFEANIMGSGDIEFRGTAASAEGNVMGSGDIRLAAVTGSIERSTPGSGNVIVGR